MLGVVNLSGGSAYSLNWPEGGVEDPTVWSHWVAGAAEMGGDALLPSFWLYSENDIGIPGPTARQMFEAYNEAGGLGFLLMLPPYLANGHLVFSEPSLFVPQLNDFFATIGLRNEVTEAPSIVWTSGGGSA